MELCHHAVHAVRILVAILWSISGAHVTIDSDRSDKTIIGGYSAGGNASNNWVIVINGKAETVQGGNSATGSHAATDNHVILSGATVDYVLGGAGGSGDLYTGNTLTIKDTSTVSSKISNFQKYEFAIPKSFGANGSEALLQLNGTGLLDGIDFGTSATAKIVSIEGSRNVGDVFQLLGVSGTIVNQGNLTTSATETDDATYKYTLSWVGKILQATINDIILRGSDFGSKPSTSSPMWACATCT